MIVEIHFNLHVTNGYTYMNSYTNTSIIILIFVKIQFCKIIFT